MEALRADETALNAMGTLVLDGEGWHRGVIGILASRVVERMRRPALVIAHEDGQAHGSGRSVSGFHLLDAITAAHSESEPLLFDRFGGHAHAVGFSLPSKNVPLLRDRLAIYSAGRLSDAMLQERIVIDAELPASELGQELLKKLHLLEPFGQANREPVFLSRACQVVEPPKVLKDRHIKLRIRISPETTVDCLGWSREILWPQRIQEMEITIGSQIDVVYRVRENKHPQFGGAEMELCDLRVTQTGVTI
jgi:single-stranded-DNA-specific exonuclease